jgi:hypothetical protein
VARSDRGRQRLPTPRRCIRHYVPSGPQSGQPTSACEDAMSKTSSLVAWFEDLERDDVPLVGGKNASLGEMVRHLGARGWFIRTQCVGCACLRLRGWRSRLAKSDACRPRACAVLILRTHSTVSRQTIEPVEQFPYRCGPPETVSPCCWNSTCREGRRDGVGRSYATRPYLGDEGCQRDSPRICLRRADSAGSLASLRRRHRFNRHCITVTLKPAPHAKPQPNGRERLGSRYGPVHRGW